MNLVKQSGTYLFGRGLPAIIGLGAVAIYTRLLDPSSVGAYALILSVSLLSSGLGYTWLRVAALRMAAGVQEIAPDFAATIAWSFVGASAFIALGEAAVLRITNPTLPLSSLLLAVCAAVAIGWYDLNTSMLQARLNVVSWGIVNFCRAAGALGFSLVLIWLGWRTDALLGGFVAGNLATLIFIGIWRPALRGSFDRELVRKLFLFGWPSSLTVAVGQLATTAQRYLIAISVSSAAVGIYAVASDFSNQVLSIVIGSISLAGIPLAYKAKDQGGPGPLAKQLRENARLIFAIALPAAAGLAALSVPIAHVFLGARFREDAGAIIAIAALTTLATGLRTYYFDQAFELAMHMRPQAIITVVGASVVIVSSLLMIPRFGLIGAALSVLAASMVTLALSALWGRKVLRMPVPVRSWLKTGLAVAGMIAVVIALPAREGALGLAAAVILGGGVYALLSALTRLRTIRTEVRRFAWLQR